MSAEPSPDPREPVSGSPLVEARLVGALLARCRFPAAGAAASCAVSGGADSLALLVLASAAGCVVTTIHVDHGSRDGSHTEADLVREVSGRFGATFRSERISVPPGPNFESRARAARYAVLPDDVLTGHTADDQAETVLLQLLRGAGLDGVAGIRPDRRHPLLALRRAETRALCAALGLDVFDDPSNADPAHRRNRVRHEVLPQLDDVAGRDVVPLLTRFADHARDAADYLRAQAAVLDPTDGRGLAEAPAVLARVAVREWLRSCSVERQPPDTATVERVLAVARLDAASTDVGGGWRVERTAGRLRLVGPADAAPGRDAH